MIGTSFVHFWQWLNSRLKVAGQNATSRDSFSDEWRLQYCANREYYSANILPWGGPGNLIRLESEAEARLINALELLYACADPVLYQRFLAEAMRIVDRAISNNVFILAPHNDAGFPRNRGEALRSRAYATALLKGALDDADLYQASSDYESYCNALRKRGWDSQSQAFYLNSVRLSLVAGNIVGARNLLKCSRSLRWHKREAALYRAITEHAAIAVPVSNTDVRNSYWNLFSPIRSPSYKTDVYFETDIARLEMGAIWYRYFVSGSDIDWAAVIEIISH